VLDQRGRLLVAALGFAGCSMLRTTACYMRWMLPALSFAWACAQLAPLSFMSRWRSATTSP